MAEGLRSIPERLAALLREVGAPGARGPYPGWQEDRLSLALSDGDAATVQWLLAALEDPDESLSAGALMGLDAMNHCPSCGSEISDDWKIGAELSNADGFCRWRESRTCPSCGAKRERETSGWVG